MPEQPSPSPDSPAHRYDAALANQIELNWQHRWADEGLFEAANPVGALSEGFDERPKLFVMDMFPYPSGAGLHVGHPLGFLGTDVYARYKRMAGHNVLHTMGYDAFGLPAEQYAVQVGRHPRVTTEQNVANMRRQLNRLGMGHDPRRSIATTDPSYYRWTQWIFLQIFNSWYDDERRRARPISELIAELDAGARTLSGDRAWSELDKTERERALLDYRLAYVAEAPVNWCPALGTVLANEEVTNDGRSERGNFPVYRRPMLQWMMRITAFGDRLLEDLDQLDWPESIKLMQRNWIGRSTGALVNFRVEGTDDSHIEVFTTRPDTLFGATYMVLAPEHPLVDSLVADRWPEHTSNSWKGPLQSETPRSAIDDYKAIVATKSDRERQIDAKHKSGVFTGSYAINPVDGARIPVFVADYVLVGYGTGAIMAVPAHDQRDFDFAKQHSIALKPVIRPDAQWCTDHGVDPDDVDNWPEAFDGEGDAINSSNDSVTLDGLRVDAAKERICQWLEEQCRGSATVNYRLRDWLFSRQRYWGEPFPIVWDEDGLPRALDESALPVELPELDDYAPKIVDADEATLPEPPLGRAAEWKYVRIDLGDGEKTYRRELNTMPQWAGSCWYYLRYIDPVENTAIVDPENERYWMTSTRENGERASGGVDLYVGGVEHAVLHLLYSRFWHKVLFDLGHVSTVEPFQRLYNQGYILADAFTDERGFYVDAHTVERRDGRYFHDGKPVALQTGKMGKSLKNTVNPDDIYKQYGADSLRLYELAMGPLDTSRPWSDQGIVGLYRFLQRLWRNLVDEDRGDIRIDGSVDEQTTRLLHKTIAGVRDDMEGLRFNTAIAKLIELNNHLTKVAPLDRSTAETVTLMLAPLAPHIAEELWSKLGYRESLTWHPFPTADPDLLTEDEVEMPIQVQGKVRGKITVPVGTTDESIEALALADPNVVRHLEGKTVRKVIVVKDRLVNVIAG